MIAFLKGQVLYTDHPYAIISLQGVGYQVYLLKNDLDVIKIDQEVSVFIHTQVKEDAIELYGFFSHEEKQAFQMLIGINGIGPKIAMNILSGLSLPSLLLAISQKDIALLCQIPGIGKKTAERMALELNDKVQKLNFKEHPLTTMEPLALDNLKLAIKSLGFSKEQSDLVLSRIPKDDLNSLPFDALVKKALNIITAGSDYGNFNR